MGKYQLDMKNAMMETTFLLMVVLSASFNVQKIAEFANKVFVQMNVVMGNIYLIIIIVIQFVVMEL